MPIKNYKPMTPGRRGMSVSDFAELTRGKPERSLLGGRVNKSGGRNAHGHTTSWHRGAGRSLLLETWFLVPARSVGQH